MLLIWTFTNWHISQIVKIKPTYQKVSKDDYQGWILWYFSFSHVDYVILTNSRAGFGWGAALTLGAGFLWHVVAMPSGLLLRLFVLKVIHSLWALDGLHLFDAFFVVAEGAFWLRSLFRQLPGWWLPDNINAQVIADLGLHREALLHIRSTAQILKILKPLLPQLSVNISFDITRLIILD